MLLSLKQIGEFGKLLNRTQFAGVPEKPRKNEYWIESIDTLERQCWRDGDMTIDGNTVTIKIPVNAERAGAVEVKQ